MALTTGQGGLGIVFAVFAGLVTVSAATAVGDGEWLRAGRGATLAGAFVVGALVQLRWEGHWPVRAVVVNTLLVAAFLVLLLVDVV